MAAIVTPESTRSLLLANAGAMLLALVFKWPLGLLLLTYWLQSVVIGYHGRKRILSLKDFSTEGFDSNFKPGEDDEQKKRRTANFFTLHFGFFHLGYLVFILPRTLGLDFWDWVGIAATGVGFAYNHALSFRQNIEADIAGRPNIGSLMFIPYVRVVPLHLTFLTASAWATGFSAVATIVFCLLKTAADVALHRYEHHLLQRGRAAPHRVE
jgi:hypothetical protein